ncbi:MAG: TonB-dependent receptor, partial [Kordiimonadaceae bacterium]|nr:TonB-dependent receptor [Kordiimonadaceae bacterium]
FVSWSDEDQKVGLSLFGNYSRRDQAAGGIRVAGWDIFKADAWAGTVGITPDATITGLPTDGSQLTATPRDSRYQFAQISRERINGQAVFQFNPMDSLRFTADVLYAETQATENRTDISNWFDRPFDAVTFDDSPVATAVFLSENKAPGQKDWALQQTHAATIDKLQSFGANIEWDANDTLTFTLDAHTSKASVKPNARTGFAETNVGLAMPIVTNHSVDFSTGTPFINVAFDDSITSNGDGILNVADVSTTIANDQRNISQVNKVDQIDFRADWALDDDTNITVGGNWRKQENETFEATFRQSQGGWGASNPGDVESFAPGALEVFDWDDVFSDFIIPSGLIGVQGNALDIWEAAEPFYTALGNSVGLLAQNHDITEEKVLSVYAQFDSAFELADRQVRISAGVRYEQTDVTSFSQSAPTTSIIWDGDNDFINVAGAGQAGFSLESTYSNFLPNLDLAIDMTDDFVARFSYSKTLARANFSSLKASTTISTPPGPSALGNPSTATQGNPGLLPLVSENLDLSFEWYYGDDDWVSLGVFHKDVKNFVGNVSAPQSLFGIRDASAATAPTVVAAMAALQGIGQQVTNTTLFAMAQLIDAGASVAAATTEFQANVVDGVLDPAFAQNLEDNFDILATSADPLYLFNLTSPQNIESAKIRGIEFALQHFFGETGFGVAGSYTLVDSDLSFDVTADPTSAQFALVGLSDTANLTLIYEKDRWSGRVSYNWRDEFLSNANRGDSFNNPTFTEAFASIDANLSYDVTDDITVTLEAINITGENSRDFNRANNQLWYMRENAPRYTIGARYKF